MEGWEANHGTRPDLFYPDSNLFYPDSNLFYPDSICDGLSGEDYSGYDPYRFGRYVYEDSQRLLEKALRYGDTATEGNRSGAETEKEGQGMKYAYDPTSLEKRPEVIRQYIEALERTNEQGTESARREMSKSYADKMMPGYVNTLERNIKDAVGYSAGYRLVSADELRDTIEQLIDGDRDLGPLRAFIDNVCVVLCVDHHASQNLVDGADGSGGDGDGTGDTVNEEV